MTATTSAKECLDNLAVSSWLVELHMECYKTNLEAYETIKALLDLRESDIKKLGVSNSKDRLRMMNSLASFRLHQTDPSSPQRVTSPLTSSSSSPPPSHAPDTHKSLLRRGSLRKNIKSFLGSSSTSKKGKNSKKVADLVMNSDPAASTAECIGDLNMSTSTITNSTSHTNSNSTTVTSYPSNVSSTSTPNHSLSHSLPLPPKINIKATYSAIADYEELPEVGSPLTRSTTMENKPFHVSQRQPAIENEYVPSPENSPLFKMHRLRSNTLATLFNGHHVENLHWCTPQSSGAQHAHFPINSTAELFAQTRPSSQQQPQFSEHQQFLEGSNDPQALMVQKHLSVVSMESGLGFGYDVEKDFNPAQPLELQPWFHGKIRRADAEALLHDDGDFLVRENITLTNTYTLTLRWRGMADHTLIGTTEVMSTSGPSVGTKLGIKYQFDGGAFDSIPELIYNHLKYQIPVEMSQHTLITNPVSRLVSGGKIPLYASLSGGYAVAQQSNLSWHSPGRNQSSHRSVSPPETGQQNLLKVDWPVSASPHNSPRVSPFRQLGTPPNYLPAPSQGRLSEQLSTSSGELLEEENDRVEGSLRNSISPPLLERPRARTLGYIFPPSQCDPLIRSGSLEPPPAPTLAHGEECVSGMPGDHRRAESFEDYEIMESVTLRTDSISLGDRRSPQLQQQHPHIIDSYRKFEHVREGSGTPPREKEPVKYAEIRFPHKTKDINSPKSKSFTINYAEVQFNLPNVASSGSGSHHSPLYDIVPKCRRGDVPPQSQLDTTLGSHSRMDTLTQHVLQEEAAYAIPNSATSQRLSFKDSSPGPGSPRMLSNSMMPNYTPSINVHPTKLTPCSSPSHVSYSSSSSKCSSAVASQESSSPVPISHTDASLYALPKKHSVHPTGSASQDFASSYDSTSTANSGSRNNSPGARKRIMGSSLVHSQTLSTKVQRNLPGYETLVRAHTILHSHSNKELAYHMTRTDAVCFMLAPRPAEDKSIWKERVKQVTSCSGMFCGLQTLADQAGGTLWKKLYNRHLSLSQTITLIIITGGDTMERTKLLRRFIKVAQLLQSQAYGNLFSFMAIMHGLAASQLCSMTDIWTFLNSYFPEESATYKSLQAVLSTLEEGNHLLSLDDLTIPAIQPLKPIFDYADPYTMGVAPSHQVVNELAELASKMEALRNIVSGTSRMTINAWRKLAKLQYNVNLMEFFTQDFTRIYLQSINNVHCDNPLERQRKCSLLMTVLADRAEMA